MTGAASTRPPAMPRPLRTLRREIFSTLMRPSMPRSLSGCVMMFMSDPRRSELDRVCDALVAAAAIARHRFEYLIVCRFWIFHQQCGGLHDLAGLAIAALRDISLAPRLLNRVITGGMQAFDGRDLSVAYIGNRGDAGAYGLLIDNNGACATESLAAAEFRARQSDFIPDKPE